MYARNKFSALYLLMISNRLNKLNKNNLYIKMHQVSNLTMIFLRCFNLDFTENVHTHNHLQWKCQQEFSDSNNTIVYILLHRVHTYYS